MQKDKSVDKGKVKAGQGTISRQIPTNMLAQRYMTAFRGKGYL